MANYLKGGYWFGLSGGVLCLIAFWVMQFVGLEPVDYTLFFACLITPVFVFIGIKHFRDHYGSGEISFAQGMTVGFFIYMLIAIVTAGGIAVFLNLSPDIFLSYKADKIAWLQGKEDYIVEKINQEAFEETLRENQNMSISDIVLDVLLKIFILEMFFTIIISIILKRLRN